MTPDMEIHILKDLRANNGTLQKIALRYNVSKRAVSIISAKYREETKSMMPAPVTQEITVEEIKVNDPSSKTSRVYDSTLDILLLRLQREKSFFIANPRDRNGSMELKELVSILKEAAPYILSKKDTEQGGNPASMTKLHKLFENEIEKSRKNGKDI